MGLVYAEEEMKNRVQDVAGVLAGEVGRGFNTNNDQPENGGDPRFNKVLLVGAQDRRESYSPPFAKSAKDRAHGIRLFDGIVGGFAGDHDIVHMALAQASTANANETRLL